MSFSEMISPLVGRLALAWFFLGEAWSRGSNWDANVSLMSFANMPAPPVLLALAVIVMALGGVSLLLGFHARHGAILLFGFTVVATILMHDYWNLKEAAARADVYELFARDIAIAGGLLLIVGMGAGPLALDNTGKPKKR
jgi:putative oxidoreductase